MPKKSNIFSIPGYQNFLLNRTASRGGGVYMMVKGHIICDMLPEFCRMNTDYECLSVISNRSLVAVVYRPPSGNFQNFMRFLESLLSYVGDYNYDIILGGDFNVNMLADTANKRTLEQTICSFGCSNVITVPTRLTITSSSLLDLFITNIHPCRRKAGVMSTDISDHNSIYLCVYTNTLKINNEQKMAFQEITPRTLETFREKVESFDWSEIFKESDPDCAYSKFVNNFLSLYNQSFPHKLLRTSKKFVSHGLRLNY